MIQLVYIRINRIPPPRWCVLRYAYPSARITTLCAYASDCAAVLIATQVPVDEVCPACRTEISAGAAGFAVAADPQEIATPRTLTPNFRGPRSRAEWDSVVMFDAAPDDWRKS